jgi:7-cyano-7-deazaguanine synthase in queuosine biosynthesis
MDRADMSFAAQTLTVAPATSGGTIELAYTVDAREPATIRIRYPGEIDEVPAPALDLIAAAAAIYLGSLALAKEVRIERALSPGLLGDMERIVEMLYDIRRWKDELPLGPLPTIVAPASGPRAPVRGGLDRRASAALWSGGKDSTLSVITLRANGYEVHPLHLTVNSGVEEVERQAVARLAAELGESPVEVRIEHDDFIAFTGAYAREWDRFPLCNRIPFGRDLLTAAVAVPFALRRGAARISMGHDNECRTSTVDYQGKRIPRNDLESREGALVLEAAMRKHIHPDLGLLPPVGTLSELRILHDMFTGFPKLMALASFCFWGDNCGRCAKCLRYYLADQVYGGGRLTFAMNPLAKGACPELADLLDPAPRSTLFQTEVLLLLGRLTQLRDPTPDETELRLFRERKFASVAPFLDGWETELLAERADPQVPPEFAAALAGSVGARK